MNRIKITIAVDSTGMPDGVDPIFMRETFDRAIVELARATGAEITWRFGDQTHFSVVARSTIDFAVKASDATAKVLLAHRRQGAVGLPVEPDLLHNADMQALIAMRTLNLMLRDQGRQN
jgi:hypothetical protein